MHGWGTFGAWMNHRQTWTHKTHHSPDLGEATTFPFTVFFVPGHGTSIQMSFCPELPSWSPEIPKIFEIGTSTTLDVHNFVCKPLIEMNFEAKL
jgi:hypothetical protein